MIPHKEVRDPKILVEEFPIEGSGPWSKPPRGIREFLLDCQSPTPLHGIQVEQPEAKPTPVHWYRPIQPMPLWKPNKTP
jgi:hypothetical protein